MKHNRTKKKDIKLANKPMPIPIAKLPKLIPKNSPTTLRTSIALNERPSKLLKVRKSTIAIASFNTLSPKIKLYTNGCTLNSLLPIIDNVATGSVADINAPNCNAVSGVVASILKFLLLTLFNGNLLPFNEAVVR